MTLDLDFTETGTTPVGATIEKAPPFTMSLEIAKKFFKVYEDRIDALALEIDALEVDSDATAREATELVAGAMSTVKALDKKRKELVAIPAEFARFIRALNAFVKTYRDKLEDIAQSGKDKIGDYSYVVELKRRADEKKANDEARKKQAALDAAAKKAKVEPVQMPTMVAPRKTGPIRTASGTASTRMVWTAELVDIKKAPPEYLMVNEDAIEAALAAGIREIPGFRVFEKPHVSMRTG